MEEVSFGHAQNSSNRNTVVICDPKICREVLIDIE